MVAPGQRRRGVGRALLAAAVHLADEPGIEHVLATAAAGSREGNRYLARLGFAPLVVHRIASTGALRRSLGMTDVAGPDGACCAGPGWSARSAPASRPRRGRAAAPERPSGGAALELVRRRVARPRRRATLLLLDGHSLAYRAFYALREVEMSTTTGQPTNAVFGFTSMLINLMRDEEPTHVAVAFDVSRKTFRSEAYADYKAGRSETPDDFRGQVDADPRGARRAAHPDR